MLLKVSLKKFNQINTLIEKFHAASREIFRNLLIPHWVQKNDQDIDKFDHPECYYFLSFTGKELVGGARITSSLHSNLTFDFFKKYLPFVHEIERANYLLEVSNFGVKLRTKTT